MFAPVKTAEQRVVPTAQHLIDALRAHLADLRLVAPSMARQPGRERRVNQDEKRQPSRLMIAPSLYGRKSLLTLAAS